MDIKRPSLERIIFIHDPVCYVPINKHVTVMIQAWSLSKPIMTSNIVVGEGKDSFD